MKTPSSSSVHRLTSNPALFALLLIGFVLSGCATKSVDTSFAFTPETETGLVVGSASSDVKDESWYDGLVKFYYIKTDEIGKLGTKNAGFIYALPPTLPLGAPGDSEFSDSDGSVFAIALEPGDYILSRWEIEVGAYAIIYPVDPAPLPFTVEKGKATYVGNLHMFFRTARNIIGLTSINDGRPAISDRSERDLPLLLERYPNLKREEIEIEIIDDRPWGGKGPPASIEAMLRH
ncbi:hypothetical protein [Denitrobaculum tricleocarpae]|uniref:Lipoprotein n=1 Tax=Denitrobaculum tricleocarpae TaxID=2591009 RepID=A0A545TY35_9PROT|nr:hypothetical protein [Denitrobaculum tricleocarpae]TQV82135.1 hypothetical protein FKG95_07890 [Denitrobaculum tricleocarpae]